MPVELGFASTLILSIIANRIYKNNELYNKIGHKMTHERKCYEVKSICGTTFYDYWDLGKHPLYIMADKKCGKPYLRFGEEWFDNSTKVNSLTAISRALTKAEWTGEKKYWSYISDALQGMINISWSPLK